MQGFAIDYCSKEEAQIIAVERRSDGDDDGDGAPFAASGHSPVLVGRSLAPLLLFAYRSTLKNKKFSQLVVIFHNNHLDVIFALLRLIEE